MQFDYISINFAPLAGIFFLLLYLYTSSIFDAWITRIFRILSVLELVELAAYSLELWTSTFSQPTVFRVLLSAVGYTIRPVLIYGFVLIHERRVRNRREQGLLAIPVVLNALVAFSAFFTDIAYAYDANNQFVRGPLGYTTHVVLFFYLAVLLVVTLKKQTSTESWIIYALIALIAAAIVAEKAFSVRSIGRTAMVLATLFYYMYFQTQVYQQDIVQHMEEENRALQATRRCWRKISGIWASFPR